ncbi:hypothetical protein RIF29_13165 [Crotalaria pallida]|uniref:Uncharacterized protein n=1 Tax=Crotalaria pallida TaxID=3830 RepID=A0AAN9INY4_CROPI
MIIQELIEVNLDDLGLEDLGEFFLLDFYDFGKEDEKDGYQKRIFMTDPKSLLQFAIDIDPNANRPIIKRKSMSPHDLQFASVLGFIDFFFT